MLANCLPNKVKHKTSTFAKRESNMFTPTEQNKLHVFAPKLDASALARDALLINFRPRFRKQLVKRRSKTLEGMKGNITDNKSSQNYRTISTGIRNDCHVDARKILSDNRNSMRVR